MLYSKINQRVIQWERWVNLISLKSFRKVLYAMLTYFLYPNKGLVGVLL